MKTSGKAGDIISVDFNSCAIFKDRFTKVRGKILDQSMAVSSELDLFFDTLDVQKPDSKPGEGCMDKWKLFRKTLHKLPEFKAATKKLRKDVHEAIGLRDKYAHADLGFTNNQPEIEYEKRENNNIETVVEPINDEVLDKDLEFFEKVKVDLRRLNLTIIKYKKRQSEKKAP